MSKIQSAFGILILFFLIDVLGLNAAGRTRLCAKALGTITVGSFNAYNLFDPSKEIGKEDSRPPGLRQWVVDEQIKRITELVIKSGKPDVLVAMEIENENVGHQLALSLGYKHMYLTKSPDRRGIDVAVFFNESNLIKGARARGDFWQDDPLFKGSPTRDLLMVDLDLAGNRLIFLVTHWPSLHNPPPFRRAAAKRTREIALDQKKRFPNATIVVLGDFNTHAGDLDAEGLNAYYDVLLSDKVVPGPTLIDAHQALPESRKKQLPPGTYFFVPRPQKGKAPEEPSWNLLDRIAVLQDPDSPIQLNPKSFDIVVPPEGQGSVRHAKTKFLVPLGFRYQQGKDGGTTFNSGVSDHFMVTAVFNVTEGGPETLRSTVKPGTGTLSDP